LRRFTGFATGRLLTRLSDPALSLAVPREGCFVIRASKVRYECTPGLFEVAEEEAAMEQSYTPALGRF